MTTPLYIHVHIPKTAGSAFNTMVFNSLGPYRSIQGSFSNRLSFFNIKTRKQDFFEGTQEAFDHYILSLSPKQRDNIHCLFGHDSYYGVHQLFSREPKYFAFFRDPIARVISIYNYRRMTWEKFAKRNLKSEEMNPWEKVHLKRAQTTFLIDGRIPSFEEYIADNRDQTDTMTKSSIGALKRLGFVDDQSERNMYSDLFEKLYFVGITENFDEDSLFLFHELGINTFDGDRNASTPYVSKNTVGSDNIRKLKDSLEKETFLYEAARSENAKFKKRKEDFYIIINKMKKKQKRFLFFYQFKKPLKNFLKKFRFCVWLNKTLRELGR